MSERRRDQRGFSVHRAIVDEDIVRVGCIHQLIAALDDAGAHGQRFQQQEFRNRQGYGAPVPCHLVPRRVHHQSSALEDLAGAGRFGIRTGLCRQIDIAAPQDRAHAGEQEAQAEGFGYVIVRAHRETGFLVLLVVLAGEEDHGERGMFAQAPQQFHPVHARHLDVEHGQMRRVFEQRLQRRLAFRIDARGEAFRLQGDRDRGEDVAIIVHQRDHRLRWRRLGGGGSGLRRRVVSHLACVIALPGQDNVCHGGSGTA